MYEAIPNELKAVPNWVCWKSEPDPKSHSGIKKIPVNPKTGGQAMSNNPETWSSFEIAVRESAKYSGIGFMFTDSGFFGVDLDDCREAIEDYSTDGTDNIVYEFIYGLNSYTELSQSGNGIHIICKGKLPEGARRKGKVEMYDKGRYFIMTGNSISEFDEIANCTETVKPLHEKYLGGNSHTSQSAQLPLTPPTLTEQEIMSKAMTSQNGDKFAKLYKGDISDYPSQSEADMAFCAMLAFWCSGDTALMDRIYRSSGLMRPKWDRKQNQSTYGAITLAKAVSDCANFYTPSALDHYSFTIGNMAKPPSPEKNLPMHTLDDTGNAERMNDFCGNVFRYNYTDKRWMYYKNGVWLYDDRGAVFMAADVILERMKMELKSWTEHDGGSMLQNYQKHMKKTRSHSAKENMIKEFQHLVPISPSELDTHKTLVNAQNGIADLETGVVSSHNAKLYMTRMLGTTIPENPKYPVRWTAFLEDIFGGDKELIRYIQKALGYCLSGLTTEQCVFFLYGNGRNGKSTFLEIVRLILGEYATNIQPESILIRNMSSSANTDIARLKGARLVTSVEPNEGMRLNEGLIKQLTGDDMVTARKLYGDEFEFRPQFKLWLATNHKPAIRGTDVGIWRRIHVIPFTKVIPEDKVDKNLSEKLQQELPDILAWMLKGYRLWRYEGLDKPKAILDSVKEYQTEMDVLSSFIESEYCTSGGEVKASQIYAVYCQWASENNEYKMPSRKFGIEMSKRFNKRKTNGNVVYMGISLVINIDSN